MFENLDSVAQSMRNFARAAIGALAAILFFTVAAHAQNNFNLLQPLTVPRLVVNGPSAIAPLSNGGAFIAGAAGSRVGEVYNAANGSFSAVDMGEPYQTATAMSNGTVLLACSGVDNGSGGSPAAIYDPSTGATSRTGDMPMIASACTATLLNSGEVLIAGGIGPDGAPLSAAAIYEPANSTFVAVAPLNQGRYGHTATLLNDGSVLIAGGTRSSAGFGPSLSSAELYDPSTGQFSPTGAMGAARAYAAAALLPNGEVLISGGEATFNDNPTRPIKFWDTAEVYNPEAGAFSPAGTMRTARTRETAAPLPDGRILIAGGLTSISSASATASTEVYDPATDSFAAAAPMLTGRSFMAAASLPDGQILVAGGLNSSTILDSAEIYTPTLSTARRQALPRSKRLARAATPIRLAAAARTDAVVEQLSEHATER